jgi:hypothetical protein
MASKRPETSPRGAREQALKERRGRERAKDAKVAAARSITTDGALAVGSAAGGGAAQAEG